MRRSLVALSAAAAGVAVARSSAPDRACALAETPSENPKEILELVQVVFRHGARAPLGARYWPELVDRWDVCGKAYVPIGTEVVTEEGGPAPENPDDANQVHKVLSAGPGGCSKGELTRLGQVQARELGETLRRRYVDLLGFLPGAYDREQVSARTTNYSRTRATLAGVLTGLFGHEGTARVVTAPNMDEMLFANVKNCEKLGVLVKELYRTFKHDFDARPGVKEAAEKSRAILGLPDTEPVRFLELFDALTSMAAHGKAVPEGFSRDPALMAELDRLAVATFMQVTAPPHETGKQEEVIRMSMGRLLGMIVANLDRKAARADGATPASATPTPASSALPEDPSLYLFSGHDSTIMPLLVALGGEVEKWPPYISNLVLEMWRTGDAGPGKTPTRIIRAYYNGKEYPIRGHLGGVELEEFKKEVIGSYLVSPDAYAEECYVHYKHTGPAGETVEARGKGVSVGSSMMDD